jgi:hypothetical protein
MLVAMRYFQNLLFTDMNINLMKIIMLLIRKVVAIVSIIVFGGCMFYQEALQNRFLASPHYPISSTGQIVPQLIKGGIFYVTSLQHQIFEFLPFIEGAALLLFFVAAYPFRTVK